MDTLIDTINVHRDLMIPIPGWKDLVLSTYREMPRWGVLVGGIVGGVVACKGVRPTGRLIGRMFGWTPVVARSVLTACGVPPPAVPSPKTDLQNTFESIREGSVEKPMVHPPCQVFVGGMVDGKFEVNGAGVRMYDYLVTPQHVVAPYSPKVKIRGLNGNDVEVDLLSFEGLDTDICMIRLTPAQWSLLGTSKASISHEIPAQGSYVSITGSESNLGTTGALREDPSVFGRVMYTGTTKKGYSGAAYAAGKTLIGIHTNGGAVNGGYSASYIASLIQYELRQHKVESSSDYLQTAMRNGMKIVVDGSWGHIDDVRVKVGGRYHIMDKDSLKKSFGDMWELRVNEISEKIKNGYSPESFVAKCPAPVSILESSGEATSLKSGASGLLEKSPEVEDQEKSTLIKLMQNMSKTQLKDSYLYILQREKTLNSQANVKEVKEKKNSGVLESTPSTSE
uniref:Serine protease n=1 Tax=Mycroft virus TaxID=2600329 RepID=A0A5B8X9Q7_9VIRU|nr:hypothetical protein [Mycroft virus]